LESQGVRVENISTSHLPGGYVNLLDETEQMRVPLAFGGSYERLLALKRTHDP
jgi:hypothetical protein